MTEPPPYVDNRLLDLFFAKANKFLESTNQYVYAGINPGGYYNAVWCRDASYILKDWFLAGRFRDVIKEILFIWSHQIIPRAEKIIYGRGLLKWNTSPIRSNLRRKRALKVHFQLLFLEDFLKYIVKIQTLTLLLL